MTLSSRSWCGFYIWRRAARRVVHDGVGFSSVLSPSQLKWTRSRTLVAHNGVRGWSSECHSRCIEPPIYNTPWTLRQPQQQQQPRQVTVIHTDESRRSRTQSRVRDPLHIRLAMRSRQGMTTSPRVRRVDPSWRASIDRLLPGG